MPHGCNVSSEQKYEYMSSALDSEKSCFEKQKQTQCSLENCVECGLRSSVFSSLSHLELGELSAGKDLLVEPRGVVVAKQGDAVKKFIFLRKGLAKLSRRTEDGHEQIIGIARPRDFVGLLSLFSSPVYQYTISTIEDSEFCIVDFKVIEKMVMENGIFARQLLEKISLVADRLLSTRLELNSRQLRGRIAYIIIMFSVDIYQSDTFNLPISRKEIGDLIDMRVENVIRILSEFRKDGIIKIEGTQIEIVNLPMLERIMQHG